MKKIAIVRRNGLGDLLCAFPLILLFRKKYPEAELTLFAEKRNAPLLPFLPPLDETVIFPSNGNKYYNILKTGISYRKKRFDLAISAKSSPMKLVNLFLYSLGAKKRVAYVDLAWHSKLINAPISYDVEKAKLQHQALKNLHSFDPNLTEVPEELYPKIKITNDLRKKYRDKCTFPGPILLLSVTTTRPTSRLDAERYAAIVNRLYTVSPFQVLVIGQLADEARARAVIDHLRVPYMLHFPRSFEEFMVMLDMSDFYFLGDGGIAHIGAALDKPQVVLYGETNPIEWHPLSKKAETFYDPLHVNRLKDDVLLTALKRKLEEVVSGRNNL
ncbi:MAG: glycosyltransferase family 9 protein [Chlamydiales bacterium]